MGKISDTKCLRNEIIIEKIKLVVDTLNEIDLMIDSQSVELQNVDLELSDLYHLIENNELSENASVSVVSNIHKLRVYRRSLKNEHEIELTYNTHKNKLLGKDNRQFLMTEINKTIKTLGSKYKNRILTDKDVNDLLEPPKRKRLKILKCAIKEGDDIND